MSKLAEESQALAKSLRPEQRFMARKILGPHVFVPLVRTLEAAAGTEQELAEQLGRVMPPKSSIGDLAMILEQSQRDQISRIIGLAKALA